MKRFSLFSVVLALAVCLTANAQHPNPEHSFLEVYDIPTRTYRVVKEFPFVIEAPNWTPDGKWLVINKDGRLYKIAPDGSTDLIEIPTGEINACNNDHVITTDMKWIGLSSGDPGTRRGSSIYIVPFEGGEPRRITFDGLSYLHGISPNGKTAVFHGIRGDVKDIMSVPVKGGKEIRLTDDPALDDGPEFSPDGKYIWFNSSRSGRMQVWRMKANGKQQTQMTFDEDMNSWFPHISPDGKTIVYIAYHDYELRPDQHLPDLNVQLRMMPAEGGKPEVLMDLFGGQGTINVNSWSPDSKQFAYVRYRLKDEIDSPQRDMSVQLYSVRNLIGTPELFAKNYKYTFERLVQMGYTSVEANGYENCQFYGLSPAAFRQTVEAAGLSVLSSHVTHALSAQQLASKNFSSELAWWDSCIAAHKAAGIPYLVMSWSQPLRTKAEMETMAAYLDAIGAKCREAGIRFGYHCHSHEYQKADDTTMIDVFATNTKPENVFIQMDVYWAVMAGVSPVEYLRKYPGRYELLHIKDKYEIGQSGMVGFDAIFKAFQRAGTKGFVVELEEASTPNILRGLHDSAIYLRNASF